jgi:hypothetical protein
VVLVFVNLRTRCRCLHRCTRVSRIRTHREHVRLFVLFNDLLLETKPTSEDGMLEFKRVIPLKSLEAHDQQKNMFRLVVDTGLVSKTMVYSAENSLAKAHFLGNLHEAAERIRSGTLESASLREILSHQQHQ